MVFGKDLGGVLQMCFFFVCFFSEELPLFFLMKYMYYIEITIVHQIFTYNTRSPIVIYHFS